MTEEQNFFVKQQRAMEQMKEMQRKSSESHHSMPPAPPFVKLPERKTTDREQNKKTHGNQNQNDKNGISDLLGGLNLPFLSDIKNDSDIGLVLGLILILMSEKSDRLLMLSLLYILM